MTDITNAEPKANPGLPKLTADNVLSKINYSISRRGGFAMSYARHAEHALRHAPAEVRRMIVDPHKCLYVVPSELVLETTRDTQDSGRTDIVMERKWVNQGPREALCLVGCVLVDIGIPMGFFDQRIIAGSCQANGCQSNTIVSELVNTGMLECDDVAKACLAAAQSSQDGKQIWGDAFMAAARTHGEKTRPIEAFLTDMPKLTKIA